MKKFIRKVTKRGKYSYYIVLPKRIINQLRWKERQKVVVSLKEKVISIRDWKKK